MRYTPLYGFLLCIIATRFPATNAGVVPADLECRDNDCLKHDNIAWSVVNDLTRRAGGGGGRGGGSNRNDGGGGGGGGSGGGGGAGGGGAGDPHSPGGQSGEEGGFGGNSDTEGGFENPCVHKRSWPFFWNRSPADCEGESAQPGDNNQGGGSAPESNNPTHNTEETEYEPSIRNNNNKPATEEGIAFEPSTKGYNDIDINQVAEDMRKKMRDDNLEGGPWYFFSGHDRNDFLTDIREQLSLRISDKPGYKIPSMENLKKQIFADPNGALQYGEFEEYFWAAYSKAYAQAISGKVYVVLPQGRPINQPYEGRGSNWWSFEVPELTRNNDIEEIIYVAMDPTPRMNMELEGPTYVRDMANDVSMWNRGDEPLGFPGDEHKKLKKPAEKLMPDSL